MIWQSMASVPNNRKVLIGTVHGEFVVAEWSTDSTRWPWITEDICSRNLSVEEALCWAEFDPPSEEQWASFQSQELKVSP